MNFPFYSYQITFLEVPPKFAQKLRKAVNSLNIEHKASLNADHITISIGIASMENGNASAEQALLEQADLGLYAAKDAGRDQVVALNL